MTPPAVAVFGASAAAPSSDTYRQGVECGRLLAAAGFTVMTGGYTGLMEAVSRGASDGGAHVIGVTAPNVFPRRSGANRYVSEEIVASSLIDRIGILVAGSDGSIALPGSLGTMTELLVAWNLAYVDEPSKAATKPIVAVGERWSALIRQLEAELSVSPGLVEVTADVPEAVELVSARLG